MQRLVHTMSRKDDMCAVLCEGLCTVEWKGKEEHCAAAAVIAPMLDDASTPCGVPVEEERGPGTVPPLLAATMKDAVFGEQSDSGDRVGPAAPWKPRFGVCSGMPANKHTHAWLRVRAHAHLRDC